MPSSPIFFGKSFLNRVSYLRTDEKFLRQSLEFPHTVFVPFCKGEAFAISNDDDTTRGPDLYTLTLNEGSQLFKKYVTEYASVLNKPEARAALTGVSLTFLGIDQSPEIDSVKLLVYTTRGASETNTMKTYSGQPYYAINFHKETQASLGFPRGSLTQMTRPVLMSLDNKSATLYSHAMMYIDWLSKQRFCPSCGHPIYTIHGGTKLQCSNTDPSVECSLRDMRLNNLCFPRTDPTIIVLMTNRSFDKVCLVRTKRRIDDVHVMYSNVAGFMEPGETVETACVREIWEETGVLCNEANVSILMTQPWPTPANLMIGCVAVVEFNGSNELVSFDNDDELLDAKWFDTRDVLVALDKYSELSEDARESLGFFVPFRDNIYLPGKVALAHYLLEHLVDEYKRRNGH